mmetsp:Transcript_16477/g.36421  ORF Transcript_16477/g.36421 Transcript_16477/m.36421 type:complete len:305 (-) Transcript_16477:1181-2095(-)
MLHSQVSSLLFINSLLFNVVWVSVRSGWQVGHLASSDMIDPALSCIHHPGARQRHVGVETRWRHAGLTGPRGWSPVAQPARGTGSFGPWIGRSPTWPTKGLGRSLKQGYHTTLVKDHHRITNMLDRIGLRMNLEMPITPVCHTRRIIQNTTYQQLWVGTKSCGELWIADSCGVDTLPMDRAIHDVKLIAAAGNQQTPLENGTVVLSIGAVKGGNDGIARVHCIHELVLHRLCNLGFFQPHSSLEDLLQAVLDFRTMCLHDPILHSLETFLSRLFIDISSKLFVLLHLFLHGMSQLPGIGNAPTE